MTAMPEELRVAALLGQFTPEMLLRIPLEHVLALLPRPADAEDPSVRATVKARICLWHSEGAPKPDGTNVADQVIGEMRNQSRFDAGGKSRKTSAYMGGVPPSNAFEAEILAAAGLANRPTDLSFRCNVFLFEPRLWVLKKDWTNKEAKEAYDLCIIPGIGYADDGLMLFWQNRKTYVHALIEIYRFMLDGIPADADWTSAATAKMMAPMVANALMLLQLEFSTTVRKMHQLRALGETSADGPRPNMPFWLAESMKADAKNAEARRTSRGRGDRGGDRGGRGGGGGGRGNRDNRDHRDHRDQARKDREERNRNKGNKAQDGKVKRVREDAKDLDKSD